MSQWIRWFDSISLADVPIVGGKNASLGELARTIPPGGTIRVADGFATTADAWSYFLDYNGLRERIAGLLPAGHALRRLIMDADMPPDLISEIGDAYKQLAAKFDEPHVDVAVRSSATVEDAPETSFAGQHETYLNVRGASEVVDAVQRCFASVFTNRAIAYREEHGIDHLKVALSAGVQKMVRADRGAAGVAFTIDPDTGFRDVIVINGAWGLGESIVQGVVDPDQITIFKPFLGDTKLRPIIEKTLGSKETKLVYGRLGNGTRDVRVAAADRERFVLTDDEALALARCAASIERHYAKPMDIEWAKEGNDITILQARPETVQSQKRRDLITTWSLQREGKRLIDGIAVGESIASGKVVRVAHVGELERVPEGAILVTAATEPDWTPVLKRVAGIITDHGGRTCHAAIVARELGIPAIVGTQNATSVLNEGQAVTMSCAEGERGIVYDGVLPFDRKETPMSSIPPTQTRVMLNIASPAAAFRTWHLPTAGIGLARIEFIVSDTIRIHPMALARFDDVTSIADREQIEFLTRGYEHRIDYFVDRLAMGIAQIAASQYPKPVIVRTSDFKTNEYASLIGGRDFEPKEENPMLGFRGASRYYADAYAPAFALECAAIKRVREVIGLTNVIVMIPFCRTPDEADRVLAEMKKNGLTRGENGLQVYVMCEIPSNVILAVEFAQRFDGFSIGSNDLTQLVLGVDRDSSALAALFDERNDAVKSFISLAIASAHAAGRRIGICGEAPSNYPDFARFLVSCGIDSISVNPNVVMRVKREVADIEVERHTVDERASVLAALEEIS